MGRSAAERSRRLYLLLGVLMGTGFLLGSGTAGTGSGLLTGALYAAAALFGAIAGLLAFLVVADLFLSRGEDDDVVARLAGGRLMMGFVVFGAVAIWTYLFSSR